MATNFRGLMLKQFQSIVMFGTMGFHVSACGAIQDHPHPLVYIDLAYTYYIRHAKLSTNYKNVHHTDTLCPWNLPDLCCYSSFQVHDCRGRGCSHGRIGEIPGTECVSVVYNFARRIQECLRQSGGHLEHIFERR